MNFKEITTIQLSEMSSILQTIGQNNSYDFDNNSNFYILDRIKKELLKFDSSGKYIDRFNINYSDFQETYGVGTLNINNDTILISDSFNTSVLKFNTDGKYLGTKNLENYNISPFWPLSFGKNYINSGTVRKKYDYNTDGAKFIKEVSLFDSNFDFIKTLCRDSICMDKSKEYDPGNFGLISYNSGDRAYIYRTSKEKYEVIVFNTKGDSIFTIKKEYQKVPYSEEHKKMIAELGGGGHMKHKVEFKNSIHNILPDKYGRLWVRSSVNYPEDGKYYDIFVNKKLIGRQKLSINDSEIPTFVKDKLVCFNYPKKTLTIYSY
jgi:hypothetical protein